jgi:mono/diheme cytochrome c family protein
MQYSIPYDAYEENPVARGGQTLLLPPEGTVPLEDGVFAYGPGAEEAERAGRELASPLRPTTASLARGKQVFENVCAVCHGPAGQGDGPIIGRFPNPPSLTAARAKAYPDGRIVHVIARGQGIMPSHAAQVLPEDRWRVVMHVRALQQAVR